MQINAFLFALVAACYIQSCIGARIVVIYAMSSKSHIFAVMPLVEELAERGHQVTFISPFKGIAKNVKDVREITLPKAAKIVEDTSVIDWFAMQKSGKAQMFSMFYFIKGFSLQCAEEILTHPEFLDIVKKRDVDLFMVDGYFHEFLYPVFDLMKVPFISHGSSSAFPATLSAMGIPVQYAAVPSPFTDFSNQMTFFQRMLNVVADKTFKIVHELYVLKDMNAIVQKHFPGARHITEMEGEASIHLVNSHPMTNWVRSLSPAVVPLGALHTRPAKPLPEVSD